MSATCAQCGAEIACGLLDNRCPKCLLWLAIEEEPGAAAGISGGRNLAGYQLLEEIGRGGMGAVYKARQISLNRVVAVKMILGGGLASEEAVRRFRAEAAVAACLQHPHIVAVHEVGEFEGHQYFSMDYVEGKNLAELARDQPLTIRQAAGYLKTIAETLDYAHQQGILHRDLKPSNVLIDLFDQPRITDFGLAKRLWEAGIPPGGSRGGAERGQARPANSQTGNPIKPELGFTLSGQVLGSPNFMPPEQVAGRPGAMGPASDVYGMGALLYHLLTGRPPFQAASLTSLLKQVAEAEPVTPQLLNPNVPKDLEAICLKCLEKEPIRRYRSAQLLAEELGRFLAGEPIRARPVGALSKGWRWCRRQPVVAALSAGLGLSIALGFLGVVWQWRLARMEAYRSQRYAYGASMNLAQQALEENNLRRVVELLSLPQPQSGSPDVRGWEWRYFWNQCQGDQILSLGGHSNTVTSVDYLPDGHGLISASCDRTIRFWNTQTGVQTAVLPDEDLILCLRLSSKGPWMASVGWRGSINVWDTTTQKHILRLPDKYGGRAAAFSPDGTLMAVNGGAGLAIWRIPEGQMVLEPVRQNLSGRAIAFAPDGATLAFDLGNGTVCLMNVNTREIVAELAGSSSNIRTMAFSPDGHFLASGGSDKRVRVWHRPSARLIQTMAPFSSLVSSVAFSPDSSLLAAGSYDRKVVLWDTGNWKELATLRGHLDEIWSVAFSPDGKQIATSSKDRTIKLWNAGSFKTEKRSYELSPNFFRRMLSADGGKILTVYTNYTYRLSPIRNPDHSPLKALPMPVKKRWEVGALERPEIALSPNGSLLAMFEAAEVILWDLQTRETILKFGLNSTRSPILCFSKDGQTLGIGAPGSSVELRRIRSAGTAVSTGLPAKGIMSMDLSSDGRVVAIGYEDWTALIWDRDRGLKPGRIQGHTGYIRAVAVSPDGSRVATASDDATVKLWDVDHQCEIATLSGDLMGFISVVFSPDGTRLVGGGANGTIKVWDICALPPQDVLTLIAPHRVSGLVFTDQGNTLCSMSDTNLMCWEATPWPAIQKASWPSMAR